MATNDDIDARLDAYAAQFPMTPEQRALLRELLVLQREDDAVNLALEAERLLPEYLALGSHAEREAQRLERDGHEIDEIERRLFDGLPRGARAAVVHARVLALAQGRRRIGLGTAALVCAAREGVARGRESARRTTVKVTAEADRFGRSLTRDWLAAAGWAEDEL